MSRPLNYEMLKYFTKVDEASVDEVMDALKADYSHHRAFNKKAMVEALMTAEKNGLITESRFDLDPKGEVRVYYSADDDQKQQINSYIK